LSLLEVAAGVAVLSGAALQAAVGFGFSLVCAPVVFAAFGPLEAVGLLTVLGLEVNLVSLLGERRRPVPLLRVVVPVLAWSVPGMLAGIAVLRSVDARVLQILLTVVVAISLAVRHLSQKGGGSAPPPSSPDGGGSDPPQSLYVGGAGLAAGVLTTTTSTAGPPLVLLLLGRGYAPIRVRDTLTTCFALLAVLAGITLAATGTHRALPGAVALAALVPLAAAGQLAGRGLFARLADGHYERALTITLALSAALGLVGALT
jgi:uncharacterized membrane protein YfcA